MKSKTHSIITKIKILKMSQQSEHISVQGKKYVNKEWLIKPMKIFIALSLMIRNL